MKKTIFTILLCAAMLLGITGCGTNEETILNNALKFKEEYESLNDSSSLTGNLRTISISEDNPFVYAIVDEIIEKIENNETFYVYFGSPYCPWCRSVIEKAIEVAKENNIDTVYYIDVWQGDHTEILRDTYTLNDDGTPELILEGGKGYKELLVYFDNVLSDYTLTKEDGNKISVGEKRIFAPNFIYVEKGKSIKLIDGISEKQNDYKMKLTDEMLEDEEKQFNEFFKN